jgi:hypothetical protein
MLEAAVRVITKSLRRWVPDELTDDFDLCYTLRRSHEPHAHIPHLNLFLITE